MHTNPASTAPVAVHPAPATAVSIPVACDRLGISRSLLYRLIERGQLRPVKLGARTLIPVSEIARLLAPAPVTH
jgi:excisionase family DNA binding protein